MATDNQGIFISENNKSKWRNIGRDLPSAKINALFVAGDDIYAGVYKYAIYNSSSNGNSWISLNERLPNLNVQAELYPEDASRFRKHCISFTNTYAMVLCGGNELLPSLNSDNRIDYP